MAFVHEDREFEDLLRIVAEKKGLGPSLVEKDYWVTHSLWALQQKGFEIWFKGGTSLSKGFGLIERFSEDLDLRIDPGTVAGAPAVSDWKKVRHAHIAARTAYFAFLGREITVPGARVAVVTGNTDPKARTADYDVVYPGHFLGGLTAPFRPFVRLEVGRARVVPCVERDIGSFVHRHCEETGVMGKYRDNRPRRLRCVHPLVTLLDKLDAISKFHLRTVDQAPRYVRHYGDAARIIASLDGLPGIGRTPRELAEEMFREKDVRALPVATDPAFRLEEPGRRKALLDAHEAIAPMFWGPRVPLLDSAGSIVAWIERL